MHLLIDKVLLHKHYHLGKHFYSSMTTWGLCPLRCDIVLAMQEWIGLQLCYLMLVFVRCGGQFSLISNILGRGVLLQMAAVSYFLLILTGSCHPCKEN